jgi:hypothetical protein
MGSIILDPIETSIPIRYSNSTIQQVNTTNQVNKRIGVVIVGQSNEEGQCLSYNPKLGLATTDPDAYEPCYFRSADGQSDPLPGIVTPGGYGTPWPLLVDKFSALKAHLKFINGAIGSLSFIKHVCGQAGGWAANTRYYQERSTELVGDLGDKGDYMYDSNKLFKCIAGNKRYAYFDDPTGIVTYSAGSDAGQLHKQINYIQYDKPYSTAFKSGAVKPALSGVANIGDTIVDNGITWQLVSNSYSSSTTPWDRTLSRFDPLGVLSRANTLLTAQTEVDEKWFFIANGQSDAQATLQNQGTIQTWYSTALQNICDYITNAGFNVAIGLSIANPNDTITSNVAYRWDTLSAAWSAACTAKVTAAGITPRVIKGVNGYTALGPIPPTYPQTGYPLGPHLTDVGINQYASAWYDALILNGFI